jgi:hypothetical protein
VEWELQPHSPTRGGGRSKHVTAPKSRYIFFIITAVSHIVYYVQCMRKYEWKETGGSMASWIYKPSVTAAMECLAFIHFCSNHGNKLVLFISHLLISKEWQSKFNFMYKHKNSPQISMQTFLHGHANPYSARSSTAAILLSPNTKQYLPCITLFPPNTLCSLFTLNFLRTIVKLRKRNDLWQTNTTVVATGFYFYTLHGRQRD